MEVKPGYKRTEVGVIPEDWDVMRLSEVTDLQVGFAFKSAWYGENIGMRLLRGENVGYGTADWSETRTLEKKSANSFRLYLLMPNDVVIGMDRTFTKTGAKITLLREEDCPCLLVQRVGRFLPQKCDQRFLWFILSSDQVKSRLRLEQKGMDIPHLSRIEILHPLASFPPLLEQRAIADALSDVDALLTALDRLIAKKRNLKQAAMQQLLTGQTRLPGFHGEWEETTLGNIGECIIGLTYKPENVVEHGLLVLRSSNIQNGRLVYDDNVYVNVEVADHLITRTGDILICVRNGSRALIGKCAVIDERAVGLTFGAFMSIYRTKYWRFVAYAFQAHDIQRQIRDNIGATINQITNKDMKAFRLKLPCENEQTAIAAVLSDMDAELVALEQRRDKTQLLKQGIMQELLTGKTRLIPQELSHA